MAIQRVTLALLLLSWLTLAGCSGWQSVGFFGDKKVRTLAEAAGKGELNEIDRLVAEGVNVNAAGKDGMTPLLWAMGHGSHEGFERLLQHGANPNSQHPGVDAGNGSSVTAIAASCPTDSFWLEAVLKHGGDPNLIESVGDQNHPEACTTPIHRAILSQQIKNLDLLIRDSANLNYKEGEFGNTPLIHAAIFNWYEGVYYLLVAGADYTINNDGGSSIVDFAVQERVRYTAETNQWKDKVLDFLEKKGVDLEAARKKVEAMGIRTKKWEPGEVYKPNIQNFQ